MCGLVCESMMINTYTQVLSYILFRKMVAGANMINVVVVVDCSHLDVSGRHSGKHEANDREGESEYDRSDNKTAEAVILDGLWPGRPCSLSVPIPSQW